MAPPVLLRASTFCLDFITLSLIWANLDLTLESLLFNWTQSFLNCYSTLSKLSMSWSRISSLLRSRLGITTKFSGITCVVMRRAMSFLFFKTGFFLFWSKKIIFVLGHREKNVHTVLLLYLREWEGEKWSDFNVFGFLIELTIYTLFCIFIIMQAWLFLFISILNKIRDFIVCTGEEGQFSI